jgi:hypothetical protein
MEIAVRARGEAENRRGHPGRALLKRKTVVRAVKPDRKENASREKSVNTRFVGGVDLDFMK